MSDCSFVQSTVQNSSFAIINYREKQQILTLKEHYIWSINSCIFNYSRNKLQQFVHLQCKHCTQHPPLLHRFLWGLIYLHIMLMITKSATVADLCLAWVSTARCDQNSGVNRSNTSRPWVIVPHQTRCSCMYERRSAPPHTGRMCDLNIALCIVAHSSGKWVLLCLPNGKMICSGLVQNQSDRAFCVSDWKDRPMWPPVQSLWWTYGCLPSVGQHRTHLRGGAGNTKSSADFRWRHCVAA